MRDIFRFVLIMAAIAVAAFTLDSCISIYAASGNIDHEQGKRTERHIGVTDDTVILNKNQKQENQ
jgi:hypothetical protein